MAAGSPRWVMVAGPNGSGKSTLVDALRANARFDLPALYINADELQRERALTGAAAQALANVLRSQALTARRDVMYETVMSHPSKIAELQLARIAGYHITVLLVATDDPRVNVARVAARVAAGGHDVPEGRTRSRYQRTLALAPIAIGYASQAFVFDNTRSGETGAGLALQAGLAGDRLVPVAGAAAWVERLVAQTNERADELRAFARTRAGRSRPQLARLDDSRTSGPLVVRGKHYVLQYDELSASSVLQDRVLLGAHADKLVAGRPIEIRYTEGVARARRAPPQRGRT